MAKKISILSEGKLTPELFFYFEELQNKSFDFCFFSSDKKVIDRLKEKNLKGEKILLPGLYGNLNKFFFMLFSPFWLLHSTYFFCCQKFRRRVDGIIYLDIRGKILLSGLAALFKIKNYWLVFPEIKYKKLNFISKMIYKISAKNIEFIAFSGQTKNELKKIGAPESKIFLMPPGIKNGSAQMQDNIFSKLAESQPRQLAHKYFSIGTVADLNHQQKIEAFFQSIIKCLTVVPNLQIIIVGEGKERKNLSWLAKKMGIGNLVWFVGEQNFLRKWLDTINLYVYTEENLNLPAINTLLNAMAAGLPVVGPKEIGLENYIFENKNGLLADFDSSEELAQAIIKLKQNRRLYQILSDNNKILVKEKFSLDNSVSQLEKILND